MTAPQPEGSDPGNFTDEARSRWGDTGAYREAARRTKGYGADEWAELKAESRAIVESLAALKRAGAVPEGPDAMAAAAAHRAHIERWFYPCSPDMHLALGESYVADPRFRRHYDDVEPGLAAYLRDAIAAASG